ncbi:helix-turn-helix domain-containing protein [Microbacterium ureisolvens]|uniref:Helix-turn-helix domain-containing protein n=1 Tax=Microbacterium ureisolvens TaxID=2781186 RepID=A0ABS7I0S5_9MICO|nr:helix-turn-helix domain-containing protein [Microbacterium ureisolvens]MBW9110704.1 helix-turn-helix domain-containing protein [Microbacterium ureisolvens]
MNLQDLVDELAETLGRSVVINDLAYRPIVASAQGDEIDEVRARALLRRVTPPRERAYLETLRVTQSRRPLTIDLAQFGAHERLAVPIWHDDTPLGVLWLITGNLPPLQDHHFRAVDAAVEVARSVLAERDTTDGSTARSTVMRGLLATDAAARRTALGTAVRSYGVERGPESVVRAVAIGYDTGVVQRAAFGRALEGVERLRLSFLGEDGAALLFLGRGGEEAEVHAAIAAQAAQAGVLVRAVGAAALSRTDDDLRPVADRAIATAAIAELLPEFGGHASSEQVAPWLLVADIVSDPARLQWYSPAAHSLIHGGDPLQRQTIEVFLDGAGHVREVCEALHIHRTTLYYRLENMPQAVRDALDDGFARSVLHLALKLAVYWEHSGRM